MYLLCILCPGIALILMGKLGKGILCIFLQGTIIGWVPAPGWAMANYAEKKADRRTDRVVRAIRNENE